MAYGNVSTPWRVTTNRIANSAITPIKMGFGTGVATYIVAASDSTNKDKADYVCDGTADEAEINQALNALPTMGGYVHLLEGTYSINSSITIPINNVSLIGGGVGTRISTSSNISVISANSLSNVLISNMNIYGAGVGGNNMGINFITVTDSIIEGCYVENCGHHAIFFQTNSDDNMVIGNTLDNNEGDTGVVTGAFRLDGSSNNIISENIIKNFLQSGVFLASSSNYNIINSNQIYSGGAPGSTSYGIETNTSTDNTITNNVIHTNITIGIDLFTSCDNNIVEGNTCSAYVSGISLTASDDNVINDNRCETIGVTGYGIQIDSAKNNTVTGNICNNNSLNGIYLLDADNNIISSNRCRANTINGINISNAACDKNVVIGNQLLGNGTALVDSGTNTEVAHNIVA